MISSDIGSAGGAEGREPIRPAWKARRFVSQPRAMAQGTWVRDDSARSRAGASVRVSGAVVALIASFIALFAFPYETLDGFSVFISIGWALGTALLLRALLQRGLYLALTVVATTVLGYSFGLGDAASEGITMSGYSASPEAVQVAIGQMLLFLTLVAAGAQAVTRLRSKSSASPAKAWSGAHDVAVVIFLAIVTFFAIKTDSWSYWNAQETATLEQSGGVRLELAYPSALFMAAGLVGAGFRSPHRWGRVTRWSLWGVLVVLIFALQSRRIMLAGAVLVASQYFMAARAGEGVFRRRLGFRALALRLAALGGLVVLLILASWGWRQAAVLEGDKPLVSDRVAGALSSVTDSEDSFEAVESRLTYLWFDATNYELVSRHGAELDGGVLFLSDLANITPRILFPNKYDYSGWTCESALEVFGLPEDLPCTPTSEALLVAGLWGILAAGLLWGVALGLAEYLMRRGPLAQVFGLTMTYPLILLEGGLFASLGGVREAALAVLLIGLLFFAIRLISPQAKDVSIA